MSNAIEILVVASVPLLRKSVGRVLAGMSSEFRIDALSPRRVTTDRISGAGMIVVAAFPDDREDLAGVAGQIDGCGRPAILLTFGWDETLPSLAREMGMGSDHVISLPGTGVSDNLADAAPRIRAALNAARLDTLANDRQRTTRPAGPVPPLGRRESGTAPDRRSKGVDSDTAGYQGWVVCIGASTGGTDALMEVLSSLPSNTPPVVVVQHMPADFVGDFAKRLDQASRLNVSVADDRRMIAPAHAYIAPGGRQIRLRKGSDGIMMLLGEREKISGHCPSVDVLFQSAASELGSKAAGVVLTGMGRDGADGLKRMRDAGARTAAQDEASSVVFGMPKAAQEVGGAGSIVALSRVATWLRGVIPVGGF